MRSFSILNSRKRAIIALVHTVIFLGVAALQTALSHARAFSLHGDKVAGGIALLAIYSIVTSVLLGDPALHAGMLRVFLLSGAVVVGVVILRAHSATRLATESVGVE